MGGREGIDEAGLAALVACFYAKVRADAQLAPVFEAVEDWPAHLEKLSAFWSSVMLTSGRFKGDPVAAHLRQAPHITPALFARWLRLWAEATSETMPPDAAAALQAKATRIAASLQHMLDFHAGMRGELGATLPARPLAAAAAPRASLPH